MKLIDKDALVAEIEKLKEENKPNSKSICEYIKGGIYGFDLAIEKTLSILDTLEVKEVELEKELDTEWSKCNPIDEGMGCEFANISIEQFGELAKHFFELGLRVNNEKEK